MRKESDNRKKFILFFIFLIILGGLVIFGISSNKSLTGNAIWDGSGTEGDPYLVTDCGELNESGYYVLQNNVSIAGTCFNITADNVRFDLDGLNVVGDGLMDLDGPAEHDFGIYILGFDNITITNGTINSFSDSGISLRESVGSTIRNVQTYSNGYLGVRVQDSCLNISLIDIVSGSTVDGKGIYLDGVNSSIFRNLLTNENADEGLYLVRVFNSSLTNITSNSNQGYIGGAVIASSKGNNFTNISILSNLGYGLYSDNSTENRLTDFSIISNKYGIKLLNSVNNSFSGDVYSSSFSDIICVNASNNTDNGMVYESQTDCDSWINASLLFSEGSCGNGILDSVEEECDKNDFGNLTACVDYGNFDSGYLACSDFCMIENYCYNSLCVIGDEVDDFSEGVSNSNDRPYNMTLGMNFSLNFSSVDSCQYSLNMGTDWSNADVVGQTCRKNLSFYSNNEYAVSFRVLNSGRTYFTPVFSINVYSETIVMNFVSGYMSCVSDVVADNDSPGGGGGSGGGGGGAADSYTLTSASKTVQLAKGASFGFKLDNASHSLKVNAVGNGSANFSIFSVETNYVLRLNETARKDFNSDGIYDLEIKLVELTNTSAKFSLQKISESVLGSGNQVNSNQSLNVTNNQLQQNEVGEKEGFNLPWNTILIVVGILVVVLIFILLIIFILKKRKIIANYFERKKREREMAREERERLSAIEERNMVKQKAEAERQKQEELVKTQRLASLEKARMVRDEAKRQKDEEEKRLADEEARKAEEKAVARREQKRIEEDRQKGIEARRLEGLEKARQTREENKRKQEAEEEKRQQELAKKAEERKKLLEQRRAQEAKEKEAIAKGPGFFSRLFAKKENSSLPLDFKTQIKNSLDKAEQYLVSNLKKEASAEYMNARNIYEKNKLDDNGLRARILDVYNEIMASEK